MNVPEAVPQRLEKSQRALMGPGQVSHGFDLGFLPYPMASLYLAVLCCAEQALAECRDMGSSLLGSALNAATGHLWALGLVC